jgi:hypothetical protein
MKVHGMVAAALAVLDLWRLEDIRRNHEGSLGCRYQSRRSGYLARVHKIQHSLKTQSGMRLRISHDKRMLDDEP